MDFERYSTGDAEVIYQEYPQLRRTGHKKEIILGHIALMQETKRQETVINTVGYLRQLGYEAKAILAGGTKNAEDECYYARLKEKVKQIGCEDSIVFLGFRSDVCNVLKCIDFLMIPSAFEGFPLAGLEANSAGVPVICADQGGSLEYADVSGAGAIFAFDDAVSAAEQILQCRSQYEELQNLGSTFASEHSIDGYKHEIQECFQKIAIQKVEN